MSPDDLLDRLTNICNPAMAPEGETLPACRWWHRAAMEAWDQKWFYFIMSRDGSELYLARFWLHQPRVLVREDPNPDGCPWDSGDSMLLHFFARGDDDQALHDHPWQSFTSQLLDGGYSERRPSNFWHAMHEPCADESGRPGEPWADHQITVRRPNGIPMLRVGHNQHAVEDVLPETWTLFQTGARSRPWGFHPPGRPWMPYRQFLAEKRAQAGDV